MQQTPRKIPSLTSGFTLIEFIVIMAIFAVMVGVIMFNFTSFRSTVTLDNLAHDIALSIRQIQVTAGASLSDDPGRPEEEVRRGIAFVDEDGVPGIDPKFVLFNDTYNNFLPDEGEVYDTIRIQTPDRITGIYYGDRIDVASNVAEIPFGITFGRYRTDAQFSNNGQQPGIVRIEITSPDNSQKRYVSINKIGQVSIQQQ